MGSGNSRMGSRPSRPRAVNRPTRSKLSFLLCGASSSRTPVELEGSTVNTAPHGNQVNIEPHSIEGSSSVSSSGTRFTSSITENGLSLENNHVIREDTSAQGRSGNITFNQGGRLSEIKELVPPHQVSVDHSQDESNRGRSSSTASTSFTEQQSSDPVSISLLANKDVVNGIDNSENEGASQICPEVGRPSSLSPQGHRDSSLDEVSGGNDVVSVHNTDLGTHVSDPSATLQETRPSGLGFLVSNREQGQGDVLHFDVVSISSDILSSSIADADTINREARRNSRRVFWDAFSRRSSRRLSDSPTIIFSTDDTDDIGSHDRWLLDFSGDFFDDGVGSDSGYLGSRIHSLNRRRRHSRSEIWERVRDENGRRITYCPSGLHPDGTCSCESLLMNEESSTRASISRIVMLAEALFEVLDEIHRQPVSLALSMVSLPAPESVVDSFPLKNHKKPDTTEAGHDVEQCYICLAEYEEGDKIRVLPCKHEYHMSCVDKWLKEIHGVCPLCRGDVREGATQCSISNSEVPSN